MHPGKEKIDKILSTFTAGLEEFDTLIVKRLLAFELHEAMFSGPNAEESYVLCETAKAHNPKLREIDGYLIPEIFAIKAVARSDKELLQLKALTGDWSDLYAYASGYIHTGDKIEDTVRSVSVEDATDIVAYLYSFDVPPVYTSHFN